VLPRAQGIDHDTALLQECRKLLGAATPILNVTGASTKQKLNFPDSDACQLSTLSLW
jgi:hypothetical protein